jgi:diadenosine tetraphosphate (Ap4A) HIT family hydrolase
VDRPRRVVDFEELDKRLDGSCFICELVVGNPEYRHHVIYEDNDALAFLDRYPALYAYVLVAPREHREHVTADFPPEEYIALQRVVYRVGQAVQRTVPTERLYILSLGSQARNRHVHWHVAPLPPGVPFAQQQFAALDTDERLDLSDEDFAELASRLRAAIATTAR